MMAVGVGLASSARSREKEVEVKRVLGDLRINGSGKSIALRRDHAERLFLPESPDVLETTNLAPIALVKLEKGTR